MRRRIPFGFAALWVVAALMVAGTALAGCGSPSRHLAAPLSLPPTSSLPPPSITSTTTATVPHSVVAPEPAVTTVAHLRGAAPASARPGGPRVATVPGNWYGYPSILPVIATAPGWLDVREAQRPNQSTAWIPASFATLSATPYFLVLDLNTAHIKVFLHGEPLASFPVGIGTTTDPTVTGDYFVAMKAPAPDPGYGPFVLATSAHSDSITDWGGSGDAIVGIHGPITSFDDQLIGTTGARISHGCIRLHDSDLAQLAGIPAGTPLDIVN